jgi:hypothetical protein
MGMVGAILFMLAGALLLAAASQWRNDRWEESAQWVVRRLSPHVLVGMPWAGLMLVGFGLMLIWPPAFLVAFGSAVSWLWTMRRSAQDEAERMATGRAEPSLTRSPAQEPRDTRIAS